MVRDHALEKYRLGTISDIDLRETQKKLIDSQYQLLLAQFRTKQAETELLRISGELSVISHFSVSFHNSQ